MGGDGLWKRRTFLVISGNVLICIPRFNHLGRFCLRSLATSYHRQNHAAWLARSVATWRQHWSNTVVAELTQAQVMSCSLAFLLWCCSTML